MSARQALLTRAATAMVMLGENFVTDYMNYCGYDVDDPETREACRADLLDPGNQEACDRCGWTYNMLCPECPGCGCYDYSCTGWRHDESRAATGDDFDDEGQPCFNCGEPGCPGYCDDYQTYNLRPEETGGER